MRTLEEIRQQNKRKNLSFDDMEEEKPDELSQGAIKAGREFYENCVKPNVRRVLNMYLTNREQGDSSCSKCVGDKE